MPSAEQLHAENKALKERVAKLETQLEWFRRNQFGGGKSERMDTAQLLFDLEQSKAQLEEQNQVIAEHERRVSRNNKRIGYDQRFANLPVKKTIELIPDEVKADPELYEEIGEESSYRVELDPPKLYKVVTVRKKYRHLLNKACPPLIAPAPSRLVEGGYAGASLIAYIALSKYVEHLPLYRLEKSSKRWGAQIPRQSMSDWIDTAAWWLTPIYQQMKSNLLNGGYLQVDETPIKYHDPDKSKGKTQQGWLWVISRPKSDVVFEWKLSRKHEELHTMLDGYQGILQSDGYEAYSSFEKANAKVTWVGCWAHARRKFHEALKNHPKYAAVMLRLIGKLYHFEELYREQSFEPEQRLQSRKQDASRTLKWIHVAAQICQQKCLPKSELGKALHYLLAHWKSLTRFAQFGEVEIDNNLVENAIRPSAIGKKNWMFVGHPNAGEKSAVIYSIVVSCQRHGIDPYEYLKDTLRRLPEAQYEELPNFMPQNWKAQS